MNKLKFKDFFKTKNNLLTVHIFQSTKSPHFAPRGKVGQLGKRKRVLCLSIYIISLCLSRTSSSLDVGWMATQLSKSR